MKAHGFRIRSGRDALVTIALAAVLTLSAVGFHRLNRVGHANPLPGRDAVPVAQAEASPTGAPAGRPTRPPRASSAAGGWPRLFGPDNNSTSGETGLNLDWSGQSPPEKWRRSIGIGYSAPVAADNRLIVLYRRENQEILECFDAAAGHTLWTCAWQCDYACKYAYSSGPYGTPSIDGECVYAYGAEGRLVCVRLDDGRELWQRWLSREYNVEPGMFAAAASPMVEDDRIILNVGGGQAGAGVVAIDKRTGKTLWTATDHGASYATACPATIHGRRYVFVLTKAALVSLDPKSGGVYWTIPFSASNPEKENATSPIVCDDLVYVSAFCRGTLCVRILPDGKYQEVWRDAKVLDSQYNNLLCGGGFVYGYGSQYNALRCVEAATGRLVWKWRNGKLKGGATLAVEDRILLFDEKGHLASLAVEPNGAALRAVTREPLLAPPCFAAPALHRGLLYLRNEDTLLCLDLRLH